MSSTLESSERRRRFEMYPKTKDSGVEWLGDIPDSWDSEPLKRVVDFTNGMAFKPAEWSSEGTPIIRIENLNGGADFNCFNSEVRSRYHVHKGDLLFGWSGNRGTSFGPFVWWRDGLHYLNQHIFRIHSFDCNPGWLYWVLKAVTYYVESQAHGIIGMVHVTRSRLGSVPVPSVPPDQQQAIAEFLDRETGEIDALVKKKERLIELLQEKRTALITHAVTKGLDPTAPTRASGIDWLGDIPAHWEILRLRRLLRSLEQGWSPSADDREADVDEWAVIKLSAIHQGQFYDGQHKALPAELKGRPDLEIHENDILLTRANTPDLVGDVCFVASTRKRVMLCDLAYRLEVQHERIDAQFLVHWLLSLPGRRQIKSDARGSSLSMVKISQGHIKSWLLPLPPLDEQRRIGATLARQLAMLDSAVETIRVGVERLKEFRTALISAAVTGKIDVREKAA